MWSLTFQALALFSQLYTTPIQGDSTLTYLALGDSYTIGESVDASQRWPVLLASELQELGLQVGTPKIVATTGWTTDELAAGMATAELDDQYDFVTLLIGVNNQYRGRSLENFKLEYSDLLASAIQLAGNNPDHVYVLSIPDWGAMPFGKDRDPSKIAKEIDAFNAIKKEVTDAAQAHYFDITPISRWAKKDLTLVASDNLHPSAKMYQLWVHYIAPYIYRSEKQ